MILKAEIFLLLKVVGLRVGVFRSELILMVHVAEY